MEDTRLGRTGLKVSRLCLGTMTFGRQAGKGDTAGRDAARGRDPAGRGGAAAGGRACTRTWFVSHRRRLLRYPGLAVLPLVLLLAACSTSNSKPNVININPGTPPPPPTLPPGLTPRAASGTPAFRLTPTPTPRP
jgi:hypothetical protein